MHRIIALVAVLALAVVAPATAVTEWELDLAEERVYFTCGSSKIGNLNAAQGETVGWSTTEPEDSYQAGAGCGQLDSAYISAADEDAATVFEGTVEGNLDALTLHLHAFETVTSRLYESTLLEVTVLIDDWDHVWEHVLELPPTSNDDVSLFELSVSGLGLLDEADDTAHHVTVLVKSAPYVDGDTTLWVWGAAEVPSGVTFNPDTLAETVIEAW